MFFVSFFFYCQSLFSAVLVPIVIIAFRLDCSDILFLLLLLATVMFVLAGDVIVEKNKEFFEVLFRPTHPASGRTDASNN